MFVFRYLVQYLADESILIIFNVFGEMTIICILLLRLVTIVWWAF